MITKLDIDVIETNNPQVLRLIDNSIYNPDVVTECGKLLITPPGLNYPVVFEVAPNFNIGLNASTLSLQVASNYESLSNLSDGIYLIYYSVAPNDKIWIEYSYLRNTLQMAQYAEALCSTYNNQSLSPEAVADNLQELKSIKFLIDGAKSMANWCNSPTKAIDMYQYADKQLQKLSNKCCKTNF